MGKGCIVSFEDVRANPFEVGGQGEPPPFPHGLEPFVPNEESASPSSS